MEDNKDISSNGENIAQFCESIISGSSSEMCCDDHEQNESSCDKCKKFKDLVEKYQKHSHKFSCHKRKKYIRIYKGEGHGRLDKVKEGDELLVPVCRLRHPKFPIDKTEFLQAFPSDIDEDQLKEAKKDYRKIKMYLLRLTDGDVFKETEEWKKFIRLSFNEFLYELGFLKEKEDMKNQKKCKDARKRYLTALRCDVKSTGMVLLKRNTSDIFTNSYNKYLLKLFQSNMDIQFICDEYAVCEYICNYLTKNEDGTSSLLKNINDEAIKDGEKLSATIKKIGKTLDKGRELSIQEAIYRALGFSMTKFSDVVRYISTEHPDRREGLLRPNLDSLEEGESIFHKSLHDYYCLRPDEDEENEHWDNMCLADFVANYNISYRKSENAIQLIDEKSLILKRKRPCVLKYYLRYDTEEEYFRGLCILFLPFRNETRDIHMKDVTELYLQGVYY